MITRLTLRYELQLSPDMRIPEIDLSLPQHRNFVDRITVEGPCAVLHLKPGCQYLRVRKLEKGKLSIPLAHVETILDDCNSSIPVEEVEKKGKAK